jgi:hypothetical protein
MYEGKRLLAMEEMDLPQIDYLTHASCEKRRKSLPVTLDLSVLPVLLGFLFQLQ